MSGGLYAEWGSWKGRCIRSGSSSSSFSSSTAAGFLERVRVRVRGRGRLPKRQSPRRGSHRAEKTAACPRRRLCLTLGPCDHPHSSTVRHSRLISVSVKKRESWEPHYATLSA